MPENDVDTKVVGKAFKVEVNGQFLPIKSYSGGDPVIEEAEAGCASDAGTKSSDAGTRPGRFSFSELKLTSLIRPGELTLARAAHEVANLGKQPRFQIAITELDPSGAVVHRWVFGDCLLTGLDFPRLDAASSELLTETVTFRPERVDDA